MVHACEHGRVPTHSTLPVRRHGHHLYFRLRDVPNLQPNFSPSKLLSRTDDEHFQLKEFLSALERLADGWTINQRNIYIDGNNTDICKD
jgi:hypothetical protein